MFIRPAAAEDVSRIAEILVFNNRINYLPIFCDEQYSFNTMQVLTVADELLSDAETFRHACVYDDGIVRGYMLAYDNEIFKLYVDPFFQDRGVGAALIEYAIREKSAQRVWVLEKNTRAIGFYKRHGFMPNGERMFEPGTSEYLIRLVRA